MADKKMNQFTTATGGEYIYAEAADGSQVKIAKANLVSMLGGLIPRSVQDKNLNNCIDLGIYIKEGGAYQNSPTEDSCLLLTIATSLYAFQWLHELNSNTIYYRAIIKYSNIYHSWVKIN